MVVGSNAAAPPFDVAAGWSGHRHYVSTSGVGSKYYDPVTRVGRAGFDCNLAGYRAIERPSTGDFLIVLVVVTGVVSVSSTTYLR